MTRSVRDVRSRTIASRFILRLEAMTGGLVRELRIPALVAAIDANPGSAEPAARPAPSPPVEERPRRITVTEVDRLKADPYSFYARSMLGLHTIDPVDAEPGPAWRGSAVHAVLDAWMKEDGLDPATLVPRIEALLAEAGTHPLVRTLWQPRLVEAVEWIADKIAANREGGRVPVASETAGKVMIAGVELRGVADRIDRLADGRLAVVDYKSGTPPSGKAVAAGYSMQLGLLAAIAERSGFDGHRASVGEFEYWSLARNKDGGFGSVKTPVGRSGQIAKEDFVDRATAIFAEAAGRWLTGDDAFTAKLSPDFAPYEDYDQLMRRDEWYGRED
jgi:ATP-dependent helicase/nuclease subunit B